MGEAVRLDEAHPLAQRLTRALAHAQGDTRFAVETFLAAIEGGHPATLTLHAPRGKERVQIEGECTTGPKLSST